MRLEYIGFGDPFDNDDINVLSPTLTANIQIDEITIKPELRLDSSNKDLFINNSASPSGSLS